MVSWILEIEIDYAIFEFKQPWIYKCRWKIWWTWTCSLIEKWTNNQVHVANFVLANNILCLNLVPCWLLQLHETFSRSYSSRLSCDDMWEHLCDKWVVVLWTEFRWFVLVSCCAPLDWVEMTWDGLLSYSYGLSWVNLRWLSSSYSYGFIWVDLLRVTSLVVEHMCNCP